LCYLPKLYIGLTKVFTADLDEILGCLVVALPLLARTTENYRRYYMKIWTIPAAMAAFALTASPVLAQATQKAPVSNSVSRAAASSDEENKATGSGVILGILAAAAIIGGIVVAAGNDDDEPASP
jgi:beta-lactamase regulating signal transducer with metallopeptidase domain